MKRQPPKPHRLSIQASGKQRADSQVGQIISAHGRHYFAQLTDGSIIKCFPKGKRGGVCVGDWVDISSQGSGAIIERLHERRNLLYRSDALRSKQFAANIDLLLIVLAAEPMFSDDLANRALVAAQAAQIEPIIILNKADLPSVNHALERLQPFADLGVPIIQTNALDVEQVHSQLGQLLENKTSLLLGQSAMGKSTLLNALVPDAQAHTQAHSQALGAGRHTTTSTKLYAIPHSTGKIIDSPGFQSFGLAHLSAEDIVQGFKEFHEPISHCRFYNCSHRHEPGCGVVAALEAGAIYPERYAFYTRLLEELDSLPKY